MPARPAPSLRPGRACALAAALLVAAGCGDDPSGPGAGGVATLELVVPTDTLVRGDTTVVDVRGRAASGELVDDPEIERWSTSDPQVVFVEPVEGGARLRTVGTGPVTVRAVSPGGAEASADLVAGVAFRGRVVPADDGSPAGLRFRVRSASVRDSAAIRPDGSFRLWLPEPVTDDSVDLIVDGGGDPGSVGRYHPVLVRIGGTAPETTFFGIPPFPPDTVVYGFSAVVVPTSWTVEAGRYAGTTVPVSLARAYEDAPVDGDTYYFEGPEGWAFTGAWPEASLPIPVGIDHDVSQVPVSAADSAAFWGILDAAEARFGVDLFRPVVIEEGGPVLVEGLVKVATDTVETASRDADALTVWGYSHRTVPERDFVGAVEADRGVLLFRDPALLRDTVRVVHSTLHVLALGHTCAWETFMGFANDCSASERPTAADVAYVELKRRVVSIRLAAGPAAPEPIRYGLEASRVGERVLVMGLPPYDPASSSSSHPSSSPGSPILVR